MDLLECKDDIALLENARKNAYAKYSAYTVGAVLVTKSGKRYTGCNIENHGIQSICAERVAFCKAISEGEREFEKIFIISGVKNKSAEKGSPCGYCRQFMSEFVDKDFKIYTIYENEKQNGYEVEEYTMKELLPYGFEM